MKNINEIDTNLSITPIQSIDPSGKFDSSLGCDNKCKNCIIFIFCNKSVTAKWDQLRQSTKVKWKTRRYSACKNMYLYLISEGIIPNVRQIFIPE